MADDSGTRQRLLFALLLAPALLWLVGLIVLPHLELGVLSLRARVAPRVYEPSLAQYRTFFEEPLYWRTFVRTAVLSVLATACTLVLAFPIAWTIAKIARGHARSAMFVMCLIPFWVSETVRTLGWMILLRETGVISHFLQWAGLVSGPLARMVRVIPPETGLASPLYLCVEQVARSWEGRAMSEGD